MLRISVLSLQPGMIAAGSVYKADGRRLIGAGATLRDSDIAKMEEWGIRSLYVQNPFCPDLEIPDLVGEKTRVATMVSLYETVQKFQKTKVLDVYPLKQALNTLISEVIINRHEAIQTLEVRTYADYTYGHSVNVCILSVFLGISLKYKPDKITELAIGALLHDFGMTLLPQELLVKPESLSPEEIAITQKHPETAFGIMRKFSSISTPAAHIAYQHQERVDGKGYPRNLAGNEILESARLVSVADIFDALLADRPHRRGMKNFEACEVIKTVAGSYIDGDFLKLLLEQVALYPVGTMVQLSTGEFAVVTKVTANNPARPRVLLVSNSSGYGLEKTSELDIAQYKNTTIVKALQGLEAFSLFAELQKSH